MSDLWASAAQTMNKFVSQDHRLGQRLAQLSKDQAQNEKVAFALELGRIYGLRTQYYEMALQRGIVKEMKQPHTEAMW